MRNGLLLILAALSLAGCRDEGEFPSQPITIICPWAVGGGTDLVSRQMALQLERELGVPVNVMNVTGGKGVMGHSRGLRAKPDGYTITMTTLELNMLPWSMEGVDFTHRDFIPLASINEDAAALFVRADAPWQSLGDLEQAILARPGKFTASGTSRGAAWHVAVVGWLEAHPQLSPENVRWISAQGAAPSLQELKNRGVDMVCCSVPEARVMLESGLIRCLGAMAEQPPAGFEQFDIKTFREQGTDWVLTGWRGLAVPRGTPPAVVEKLRAAVLKIVTAPPTGNGETFADFMRHERFDLTVRSGEELEAFLDANDQKFKPLLATAAFTAVGDQPFGLMALPYLLLGGLGLVTLGLFARVLTIEKSEPDIEQAAAPSPNLLRFLLVIGLVVGYIYIAETAGFLLTMSGLLFVMLWVYGTRWWISLLIALLFTPAVYVLFAQILRVPLPRGWLGW